MHFTFDVQSPKAREYLQRYKGSLLRDKRFDGAVIDAFTKGEPLTNELALKLIERLNQRKTRLRQETRRRVQQLS